MVGAQVEFDHVSPGTDVNGKRGELVLLHVQLLETLGSREDTVGYSRVDVVNTESPIIPDTMFLPITEVVLHVESGGVDELLGTSSGIGGELVPSIDIDYLPLLAM